MNLGSASQIIQNKHSFLLLIHHCPDGDAVASSLALWLALKSLGKEADAVCADPVPQQFMFLPGAHKVKSDFFVGDYDVIVTLDCGDSRRTGFRDRLKELVKKSKKTLINIDHHAKNDLHGLATINVVDQKAPSTSYIVHKLLGELRVPIDYKLATCLLTGLYTDTGGFKHGNTTPEALTFAADMLTHGARLKDITKHISQATSVARLKLWGIALSRIQRHDDFNIVSTYIMIEDILQTGASPADIAGIANLLTTIDAAIAILIVEQPDRSMQVRMRTKAKEIDLARLATYLGGGGQKKAAGFSLSSYATTSANKK